MYESSVVATYMDGDLCEDTDTRVTTVIYYSCDMNAGVGTPALITIIDDCQYIMLWQTAVVCDAYVPNPTTSTGGDAGGTSSGGGANAGAIVSIVFFVLIIVYFAAGTLYNRSKGKTGIEQIPHIGLFQACYYTAADACVRFFLQLIYWIKIFFMGFCFFFSDPTIFFFGRSHSTLGLFSFCFSFSSFDFFFCGSYSIFLFFYFFFFLNSLHGLCRRRW